MSHPEWNQCIECSVVSCKHHNDHGHCSLDKIKVEPTPMSSATCRITTSDGVIVGCSVTPSMRDAWS